jgi:hypothetical protein
MKYKNYPLRILHHLYDSLKGEASNEGRSINRQLEAILKERYHAHAPPTPTHIRPIPKSPNSKQNGRKTKAEVN